MTAGGTLKLLSYLKKEFWQDVPELLIFQTLPRLVIFDIKGILFS